jgi:hypothetical protein
MSHALLAALRVLVGPLTPVALIWPGVRADGIDLDANDSNRDQIL